MSTLLMLLLLQSPNPALAAEYIVGSQDRLAITARLGDHQTSMLQDLEAGRRLELDAITGAVVELADLTGVAAPALRAVHALAALAARSAL